MIVIKVDGTKKSPKQAAAAMIWTAVRSYNVRAYNDAPITTVSLYEEAGFDREAITEREEALVQTQVDRLTARVAKLLKVGPAAPAAE